MQYHGTMYWPAVAAQKQLIVKLIDWKCQIKKKILFNLARDHQIPNTLLDKVQRDRELKQSVWFYPSIHPYQRWQQVRQVLFPSHVLRLRLGDPEAFPSQIGYVILPVCSWLVQGSSPS